MHKLTILSGAALLTVAGVAIAQSGPGDRPDPNADVTRQQVIDRADRAFARMDSNHDGRFTREEAQAMGGQRRAAMRARIFDRIDANHDGNISREEFAQAPAMRGGRGGHHRGMRGMRGPRMGMGPPPGGPDGPGGPGGPGMRGGRLFGEQGFVTREQMRERALARFDRADANHDGTLTRAERREARGRMRHRMDERGGD